MSKLCPKCNHEWPDEFQACPLDGSTLVVKSQSLAGFSLTLGDANAISGGINMSDNHSVTQNTDSHNVITNNITHVEREKSSEERLLENKQLFREACKQAFSNGMCTSEDKRNLDDLRFKLGLDDETSSQVFESARMSVQRKSVVLGPIQKMTFENIKSAILCNKLDVVKRLYPQLVAMVNKFAIEELQFIYYMLQAILFPESCVKDYETHREDKYWQAFWATVAYREIGDIVNSESLLVDVGSKWDDAIPEENAFVLAVVGALLDEDYDTAKNLYYQISGSQSPYLEPLVGCLYGMLYADMDVSDEIRQMIDSGKFYKENLFASIPKPCINDEVVNVSSVAPSFVDTEYVNEKIKDGKICIPLIESKVDVEVKDMPKQEIVSQQPLFDESQISCCLNEFGYLRQLSSAEIVLVKQQLMLAPKNEFKAQFYLGQLLLQEDDSAATHLAAWNVIKSASEHGVCEAGAFMAYFYLYGKVVNVDLEEAERRIKMDDDYKKNPIFVQMMIDLYEKRGNSTLADVWKTKLSRIKK